MKPNYMGKYRITQTGNVYDCERDILIPHYISKSTGQRMHRLIINGKPTQKSTHRIVATVYIPNPNGYSSLFIHHPVLINLKGGIFWCTPAYRRYAEEQLKLGILVEPQKAKYKPKKKKVASSPPVVTPHSQKPMPKPEKTIAANLVWKQL